MTCTFLQVWKTYNFFSSTSNNVLHVFRPNFKWNLSHTSSQHHERNENLGDCLTLFGSVVSTCMYGLERIVVFQVVNFDYTAMQIVHATEMETNSADHMIWAVLSTVWIGVLLVYTDLHQNHVIVNTIFLHACSMLSESFSIAHQTLVTRSTCFHYYYCTSKRALIFHFTDFYQMLEAWSKIQTICFSILIPNNLFKSWINGKHRSASIQFSGMSNEIGRFDIKWIYFKVHHKLKCHLLMKGCCEWI